MSCSGNAIVISGTTLAITGLTFGGVQHPWSSAAVLVPLILGLIIIGIFIWYEAKVPVKPTIPWEIVSNRTSFVSYVFTTLYTAPRFVDHSVLVAGTLLHFCTE